MRRSIPFYVFFLIIALFAQCGNSGSIDDVSWLLGKWQGEDVNELVFHERWERSGAGSYTGNSSTTSPEGDTLWKEPLKIELVEGTPYYVIAEPETKTPILYKMVEGNAHSAVFENESRSFPRRISYELETANTMRVKREGIEKGQPKIEALQFERVKGDSLIFH